MKHIKWKNKIKQLANENNLSAMDIAFGLRCHYETVNSWFYQRNTPSEKYIKRLLELFHLNDKKDLFE